jgi:hypothetical protein
MMACIGGGNVYAKYGWESAYSTVATTIDKAFGHDVKISTLERRNNVEQFWDVGNAEAKSQIVKQYEGSWTADFVLGNAYWLRALTGITPTDAGSGPYTHTYVTGAGDLEGALQSMSIEYGADLATDHVSKLRGALINSMTMNLNQSDPVRVSLEGPFATETTSSTLSTEAYDTYADSFSFQMASIELPNGTTLGKSRSCDITWTNNVETFYALGSRFPACAILKNLEFDITASVMFENTTLLEAFYGSTAPNATVAETTFDVVINNGGTTTAERELHLTFGGVLIDTESLSPLDTREAVVENLTMKARNVTSLVYTDNTATAP